MTIGDTVRKTKGYAWPGVIVADFTTLDGKRRLVVECTTPEVAGALHIYNEEQLEQVDKPHPFGPNGPIVDAFITHLKGMTADQWDAAKIAARDAAWNAAWPVAVDAAWPVAEDAALGAAWGAAWAAAGDAVWTDARAADLDAAWDAASGAAWAAAGDAAGAVSEIQGAELLRERGQPFFFLPMFGFADEKEIPLT